MAGYKTVIEMLVEELACSLARVAVLETELERLEKTLLPELAAEIRAVLGPKQ